MSSASSWEYRYKFLILVLSQPALAFLGSWACGLGGDWYAPEFEASTGLVAVAIGLVGCLLRLQGASTLSTHVMASTSPDTHGLVTKGIFGAVRNPLYLGTILLFGAYGLFFDWKIAAVFVVFHWVRYDRVVRFEESLLKADWGQPFEDYCLAVPRWLPRLGRLRLDSSLLSLDSLLSNSLFVGLWLGLVASVLTGSLLALLPFEVAGGVIMAAHFARASRTQGSSRWRVRLQLEPRSVEAELATRKVA